MLKKTLMSVAPLLTVAAFAIAPAMAQARTTYGTETGGVFTAFTEFKHEVITAKKVSTTFELANTLTGAEEADVTCKSLIATGYFYNVGGVGKSTVILNFDECAGSGKLASCEINPKNNKEIEGVVDDEVLTEATVKVTISEGFNVKCKIGAEEKELGNVTGSVTGSQTAKTAVLKFAKATGLTFAGEAATITGEVEFETAGKKIII